jgi:hypothetical protein
MSEKINKFRPKINNIPIDEGISSGEPEADEDSLNIDNGDENGGTDSEVGEDTEQNDDETPAPDSKEEDSSVKMVEPKSPKEDTPVVTMVETPVKNAPERLVKIKMVKDHSCCIGGVRYHLEAGKVYNVPANVKRILSQANLLKPL